MDPFFVKKCQIQKWQRIHFLNQCMRRFIFILDCTLLRYLDICLKNGRIFCQKVPNSERPKDSFFRVNAMPTLKKVKMQKVSLVFQKYLYLKQCIVSSKIYMLGRYFDYTLLRHQDISLKNVQNHGHNYKRYNLIL